MTDIIILNRFLTASVVSGVIATILMSFFISVVSKSSWIPMSMPSIIGRIFSKNANDAKFIGWLFHIIAGVIFAFVYVYFLNFFSVLSSPVAMLVGSAFGVLHGFSLFFMLLPSLAEHHPDKSVRSVGGALALVYFFAHIVYGTMVGSIAYTVYALV